MRAGKQKPVDDRVIDARALRRMANQVDDIRQVGLAPTTAGISGGLVVPSGSETADIWIIITGPPAGYFYQWSEAFEVPGASELWQVKPYGKSGTTDAFWAQPTDLNPNVPIGTVGRAVFSNTGEWWDFEYEADQGGSDTITDANIVYNNSTITVNNSSITYNNSTTVTFNGPVYTTDSFTFGGTVVFNGPVYTSSSYTFGGPVTINAPVTIQGGFYLPETVNATLVTGTINNYQLTTTTTIQDLVTSGSTTMTGMISSSSAPMTNGLFYELVNTGSGNLTLVNQNSGPFSNNQFLTPNLGPFVMVAGYSVSVKYDTTVNKWRLLVLPNLTTTGTDTTGTPQTDSNTLQLTFVYPGLVYTKGTGTQACMDSVSLGGSSSSSLVGRWPGAASGGTLSPGGSSTIPLSSTPGSLGLAPGYDPNTLLMANGMVSIGVGGTYDFSGVVLFDNPGTPTPHAYNMSDPWLK